jgi:hypothetical protein
MRKTTISAAAIVLCLGSCSPKLTVAVAHRARNGRPDQWIYRFDKNRYKIGLDTNGDGQPNEVQTFKNNELVEIESDRDFDGQVDLVKQYLQGVLIREVHDDNFDGKPEVIKEFRHGQLAIVNEPHEQEDIDAVEYYDESGKLIRREVCSK